MISMDCTLCNQEIENFDPDIHHIDIDDEHAVDVCFDCFKKLNEWQGRVYARLFPTKGMKKRFGE